MILAHLPSGYLLARGAGHRRGVMLVAALVGAVLPDFDMLWFWFVDHSEHHHRFWPHIPAVWAAVALITLPLARKLRPAWYAPLAMGFVGVLLHLILDTWVGSVMWLWPYSDTFFQLFTVPATQSHWVLSFLLHWTVLAEVAIILAAAVVYFRTERS
ncbi:metal-dependent hydrolase [Cypionkella sinensis]|uniref:Metal-dependent hydrolase n=1 Tax=Cypionkella sinensis TaxID=1756043 RepID=A0ABV7IUI8_9RHOB